MRGRGLRAEPENRLCAFLCNYGEVSLLRDPSFCFRCTASFVCAVIINVVFFRCTDTSRHFCQCASTFFDLRALVDTSSLSACIDLRDPGLHWHTCVRDMIATIMICVFSLYCWLWCGRSGHIYDVLLVIGRACVATFGVVCT